jgi:hypothetical protein
MARVTPEVEERLRSAFPAGTISKVQALTYGDDPAVERGETVLRVFIDRGGRPPGEQADKEIMRGFEQMSRDVGFKLLDELPSFSWVEFQPDGASRVACGLVPSTRIAKPRAVPAPEGAPGEQLTPVMTRLGPDDLVAVDTLVMAGIASSRADAVRWALGRIREHPAYAQLQKRVREIEELKSQF